MGFIPFCFVLIKRGKRFKKFEEGLPDALDLMTSALRVGHSFNSSLSLVSRECSDPIGSEFKVCFDEQNYGLELRTALENLTDRMPLQDLKIVVTAILIQRESGGNLAEVLEKTAYVIRQRFRLKKQVMVHTAQGRLTGWILTILPIALGVGLYIVNPDTDKPAVEARHRRQAAVCRRRDAADRHFDHSKNRSHGSLRRGMGFAIFTFCCVFLLIGSGGVLLFYRAAMVQRISGIVTQRKQERSLVATLQQTGSSLGVMVEKFEKVIPKTQAEVGVVQQRLIRAGFRKDSAVSLFYGSQGAGDRRPHRDGGADRPGTARARSSCTPRRSGLDISRLISGWAGRSKRGRRRSSLVCPTCWICW